MIPYREISAMLLQSARHYVEKWIPSGRYVGADYVVRNPTRQDKTPGSFKINVNTGRWADFATGDTGGDLISLYAYINSISNSDAARELSLRI